MLFQRLFVYFVLFILLTSIIFVFLSGKNIKLPKSLLFSNDNNNNMSMGTNRNNLLISISVSLFITIIFIYKKENNI